MAEMWTSYQVEWRFLTKLCGSVPADPDIQRKWLESRRPKVRPPNGRSLEEIQAELAETMPTIEEEEEERLSVFQRVEGGLVMRMSTVRAHFKDCGRVMSSLYYGKPGKTEKGQESERSFNVRVLNGLYYPPDSYWVPILDQADEKPLTDSHGLHNKMIHVQTRQGQRSAFKTFEYVENALMRFSVKVLTTPAGKGVVSEKELEDLLEYGGTHGYGGERGDGEGRYTATLKKVK
jgi:hypothetical protein